MTLPRAAPGAALQVATLASSGARPEDGRVQLGCVGFVALSNACRLQREVVLVSNRHVLMPAGAARGDGVHRPDWPAPEGPPTLHAAGRIATLTGAGFEGERPFAWPGEPAAPHFVDCASAVLADGDAIRPVARGVGRLHPLDATPHRRPRVRVLGASGPAPGRVIATHATVTSAGEPRRGNIVVRLDRPFAIAQGDSGALLLDERDRAVGLLWGRDPGDAAIGYACHIAPVLACLDLTLMTTAMGRPAQPAYLTAY